jgi:outer membrane protein assembly factor BamB
VSGTELVLVPFRGKVFALRDNSSTTEWQFPPQDKETYPVSEFNRERIDDMIDALSIEGTAKNELKQRVQDLTVDGPSKDTLTEAIDASDATDDEKVAINDEVDEVVSFENDALKNLKAIYGNLGLSDDRATTYVATFRGMVFALDTDTGDTRWVRDGGSELVGGVAVDGDVLYLGTKEADVYALEADTGAQIWAYETNGEVWSTPVVVDEDLFFTSLDGTVYSLDKASGDENWTFEGANSGIAGQVTVADGALYVGAFDNRLYALNAADGTMKWTAQGDNWFWSRPAVVDDVVYAASLDGKMYAVRADDGSAAWDEPFDTGAPVRSAPVVVGEGIVVASRDAQLFKLNLETGEQLQGSPSLVEENATVEADLTQGDGGLVYVVPRSPYLYVFEAAEGLRSRGGFALPN